MNQLALLNVPMTPQQSPRRRPKLTPEVLHIADVVHRAALRWAPTVGAHPETLAGACEGASQVLAWALNRAGFRALFAIGMFAEVVHLDRPRFGPHAWVELDGWILDVTATQFGRARVHIPRGIECECYLKEALGEGAMAVLRQWTVTVSVAELADLRRRVTRALARSKP